jgi:cobalt-zinc-cadmium efflux system protein
MVKADTRSPFGSSLIAGMSSADDSRRSQQRALSVALGANVALLAAELFGGLLFGSLVLLSDAAHMLSDVTCLSIALVAHHLAQHPATPRHSFGLQRLEVLAAQANGVVLLATAGWIFYEARQRITSPTDVEGMGLLVIAGVATAGNVGIALFLGRNRGRSLNMRAAFLHKAMDVGGSAGALLAGVAIAGWGADWADPVVSILIAALLVMVALRLLRDTTHVLMEGAPQHIDPTEVLRVLVSAEGVTSVHHLHLWSLASDVPALSAHIVLEDSVSMDAAQRRRAELKSLLADRFGIHHATFEIERVEDRLPDATHRPGASAEAPPREEEPREGARGLPCSEARSMGGSCSTVAHVTLGRSRRSWRPPTGQRLAT